MIGICELSNIQVRIEPNSKSEIVTQLLFGESFNIIEQVDGWTKMISDDDSYCGWINSKQFNVLQNPIFQKEIATVFPFLIATSTKGTTMILAGSSLPNLNGNEFKIDETIYSINQKNKKYSTENIEQVAIQYLNTPYFWGGRNPFGIDCSGFVQTVFKQCGIQLKRDASQQTQQGNLVNSLNESLVGDLAFFENNEGKIIHVGMLLEKNKIIHASGKVRIDFMDNIGILNIEENDYSHKLKLIKRMI